VTFGAMRRVLLRLASDTRPRWLGSLLARAPGTEERRQTERRVGRDRRWVGEIIGDRRRVRFPIDQERRSGLHRRSELRRSALDRRMVPKERVAWSPRYSLEGSRKVGIP